MFQQVFNEILSRLEYDNIPYTVVSENGKTVIHIDCKDYIGKISFDQEPKENHEV